MTKTLDRIIAPPEPEPIAPPIDDDADDDELDDRDDRKRDRDRKHRGRICTFADAAKTLAAVHRA